MASVSIAKCNAAIKTHYSRNQHFPKFASISLIPGLRELGPSPLSLAVKRTANDCSLPIIRAQNSPGLKITVVILVFSISLSYTAWELGSSSNSPTVCSNALYFVGYIPDANFYKVEAILRCDLCVILFLHILFLHFDCYLIVN